MALDSQTGSLVGDVLEWVLLLAGPSNIRTGTSPAR